MRKASIQELAISGGKPAFLQKLHVNIPNIGDRTRFLTRVEAILDSHWLTNNGAVVQEFEQRVATLLNVKHCVAVCNATIGLQIAIRALNLKGEVLLPSFTFVATAHALQWLGIRPVFCEIDRNTHNIDPESVIRMITPDTTGIIGVHVWGRACDVEALSSIAHAHRLKLLFDAAHAFGNSYHGRMIGNFGDVEVFSFHATKFFNTFEGGAIVTNNDELAYRIRLMKNFGFAGDVVCLGTNGKMTEISAAMGLTGLDSLQEFIRTNHRNYEQYQRELAEIPGIQLIRYDETEQFNRQYIVLEIDETFTHLTRDQILEVLWAENILARRYFSPGCHQMEPYVSSFLQQNISLSETEKLSQRVLTLPSGSAIDAEMISTICQIIRLCVSKGQDLKDVIVPTHRVKT